MTSALTHTEYRRGVDGKLYLDEQGRIHGSRLLKDAFTSAKLLVSDARSLLVRNFATPTANELTNAQRPDKLFATAPTLRTEDFKTTKGQFIDFTAAKNLEELVSMIREVGEIKNQNGEVSSADTIISCIYDRVYMARPRTPYKNWKWTELTLRHRLRETVYHLAEEHMHTREYRFNRGQLNLLSIDSQSKLEEAIRRHPVWMLPSEQIVTADTILGFIKDGRFDLLPPAIKHKAIEINRQSLNSGLVARFRSFFA